MTTRDASEEGGSAPACADNVRATAAAVRRLAGSPAGRAAVNDAMGLCPRVALKKERDGDDLLAALQDAWSYMAMGNCECSRAASRV